ncbi:hypothetical protein APR41_01715 [Salegentibacter salinarum]|uniref:Outer membrane protein beta-barrel domain-containing protein n=1 Tax=Salegentibacter salinarum TaxID=447422 RepID=A0A2N0U497_9FLAO|nr:hypothetical protein [Salegentibacter salinarum]PKD21726.1 hypothetical protein APR41_01715 [Salegentibacter salinarum]SKB34480.1 hypothetical protein SAMN05660903_00219 [Salegentibacter salinarum]
MKERKNIDRLYQEKFRDFAPEPRPELWDNIAGKLQEKDKKKPFIIPLWFKVGGVAAVFALMLGGYFFSQNNFTNTELVFEVEETAKPQINLPEINKNEQFVNASEILRNINEATYSTSEGANTSSANNNSAIASENSNREYTKTSDNSAEKQNSESTEAKLNEQNSAMTGEDHQDSEEDKNQNQDFINPNSKNEQLPEAIAENSKENNEKEEGISLKDSLEVAEQLAQIEKEKNLDKEEELIAEASKKKLRLSTFAAPVFYDNIGSGNAIDRQFSSNKTSSQVSIAYGMNLAYAISEKIKIRSGISKVAMSYNVEDIVFSASLNPSTISSINYESGGNNVQLDNAAPSGLPGHSDSGNNTNFSSVNNMALPGEINQQFGFIEIPLEIEYSLLDSKIGLNLIAGGSSLFLDENSIQVNTNNQNTRIGEANNINKVSFSTNVGVGLDYKLTDSFKLNLEPIFKYQLDTFDDAPGVRPFYFGIYSGISFSF